MPLLVIKRGRIAHIGLQISLAAVLGDLGQIGCVICPFTEQGMAVDAVVFVPYILAVGDLRGDVFGIGQRGKLTMGVEGHSEK